MHGPIFFVRSCLSSYDSRMQKYFYAVSGANITYTYIGWLRGDDVFAHADNELIFEKKGRLGARWLNVFNIIRWNFFIFKNLYVKREYVKVVQAVDLDAALVCYIFCRLFKKKFIFDIYDKYTAVRNVNGFLGRLLDRLELHIAKKSTATILAGEDRHIQLGLSYLPDNFIILENVPSQKFKHTDVPSYLGKWQVGYFGVLEVQHRGIENLLKVASQRSDIELHIGGYGALSKVVQSYADNHANVHWYGTLKYADGLEMMSRMHAIVGMYYLSVPNHMYASPNKYYEHLLLGRGLLSTKNTSPGSKVKKYGTGWAIGETEEDLHMWLDQLAYEDVAVVGSSANELWNKKYKDYFANNYINIYVELIQRVMN